MVKSLILRKSYNFMRLYDTIGSVSAVFPPVRGFGLFILDSDKLEMSNL